MLVDNHSPTAISTNKFEDLFKRSKLATFKADLCCSGLSFHHALTYDCELVRNASALER